MRSLLLRMRDELVGLDHTSLRMTPAQQRLEPGNRAVLQPHDRLIVDLDLVALERAAQIGLERDGIGRFRLGQRARIERDAASAFALGFTERALGIEQKIATAVCLRLRPPRRRWRGHRSRGR